MTTRPPGRVRAASRSARCGSIRCSKTSRKHMTSTELSASGSSSTSPRIPVRPWRATALPTSISLPSTTATRFGSQPSMDVTPPEPAPVSTSHPVGPRRPPASHRRGHKRRLATKPPMIGVGSHEKLGVRLVEDLRRAPPSSRGDLSRVPIDPSSGENHRRAVAHDPDLGPLVVPPIDRHLLHRNVEGPGDGDRLGVPCVTPLDTMRQDRLPDLTGGHLRSTACRQHRA